jgi:hypothetical protein
MIKKTHEEFETNEYVTNHTNTHPDLENKIKHLEKNKELKEKLLKIIEIYLEEES